MQFGNTEQSPEYQEDKLSRMDMFVETDQKERINMEMQVAHDYGMAKRKRTLYDWEELYRRQMVVGASYQELHRVITIHLIDFVQFPSMDRYHTSYHVVEDQMHELLSDA
ncbi:MAG: Rpn family recombination-promoting nuclease/putative transposase [Acidibacillus sp.]|nr:Rpn family recombination-promoting nuclease/putative transposase [Acidibacillus sp.]